MYVTDVLPHLTIKKTNLYVKVQKTCYLIQEHAKKMKNAKIKKSMKKHEKIPSGNIAKSIIDLAITMNSVTNTDKFSDKVM